MFLPRTKGRDRLPLSMASRRPIPLEIAAGEDLRFRIYGAAFLFRARAIIFAIAAGEAFRRWKKRRATSSGPEIKGAALFWAHARLSWRLLPNHHRVEWIFWSTELEREGLFIS